VQLHQHERHEAGVGDSAYRASRKTSRALVICQEPRYIDNDSRLVHDVLTALRYDTTIDDALARGTAASERRVASRFP